MLTGGNLYHKIISMLFFSMALISLAKSQNRVLDSLKKVVSNNPNTDTNKAIALNELAYKIYPYDVQQLRHYSDEALTISLELKYKRGEALAYKNKALSFMLIHGDASALVYLDKALKILELLKDEANSAIVLNYIGCYYATVKDDKQAIIYFDKAVSKLNSLDGLNQVIILSNAGNHYEDVNQPSKALSYYSRILSIVNNLHDNNYLVVCYNDFASVYFRQGNYKLAIDYCSKALSLESSPGVSPRSIQSVYLLLGDINCKLKNYNDARSFYNKGADIAKAMKSREKMDRIYYSFYRLDSLQGNYTSAIRNFYKYSQLRDSLISLDKNNVIALYQVKFDVEKRENENTHLLIIQQKNRALIRDQRIAIAIGALSLLIISGCLFYLKKVLGRVNAQNKVINEQNKKLEDSNKVKDTIFSVVSHDLRTPISQVIGLLDLLEDGDLSREEIAELVPFVKNDGLNTLELLDNLLIWSKNQLQGFTLAQRTFDVGKLVSGVLNKIQPAIKQKNLLVTNEVSPAITAFADQEMITAVLRNLISNAIKFTPPKGIIRINSLIADEYVIIGVADTGMGIKKNDQQKIFSNTAYSTPGTDNEKGTGIGLKICQDFVKLNRGTIWMRSEENAGSTFYISIPLGKAVSFPIDELVMI